MSSGSDNSNILPFMIGTAGHVDHGKTSLVRNLSGFDTDRHPEERNRGMSIDFGVAPFSLPSGRLVGIIDVPGHEDFIRNMVAGASSIDLLMLVVAADDSVMPQTKEHLRILKLLGVSKLIAVITKTDLVSEEILPLVREEVQKLAGEHGFGEIRVFPVSNSSKAGIEELRAALDEISIPKREEDLERAFRMDVRAVFSMKGHGTVITGVPKSGVIHSGDTLELLPPKQQSIVRGIQTYRQESSSAQAHVSSAINLRDLDASLAHRGMTLCAKGVYNSVQHALGQVKNDSSNLSIRKRAKFRLHAGTAAVTVSMRVIDRDEIPPGGEAYAHFRFEQPLVLATGDRFLLRGIGSESTYGGGRILGVNTGRPRRLSDEFFERLVQASEALQTSDFFSSQLYVGERIVFQDSEILLQTQCLEALAQRQLKDKTAAKLIAPIGTAAWLFLPRLNELVMRLKKALTKYHLLNPHAWGMKPNYVAELLQIPVGSFDQLFQYLGKSKELQLKHGRLALNTFQPQISARELQLREGALDAITKAGNQSLAKGNLLEALPMSSVEQRTVVKLLTEENLIVVLGNNFLLRSVYDDCREMLLDLFRAQKVVDLAAFREKSGTSRNVAALILDSFDAEGLTKRTEAGRVLLPSKKSERNKS